MMDCQSLLLPTPETSEDMVAPARASAHSRTDMGDRFDLDLEVGRG